MVGGWVEVGMGVYVDVGVKVGTKTVGVRVAGISVALAALAVAVSWREVL
jgi:hypothetical protein